MLETIGDVTELSRAQLSKQHHITEQQPGAQRPSDLQRIGSDQNSVYMRVKISAVMSFTSPCCLNNRLSAVGT